MKWARATFFIAGSAALGMAAVASQRARGGDTMDVKLCDNTTTVTIAADAPRTKENGAQIAQTLMDQWLRANPGTNWVEEERSKHQILEPADNANLVGIGQGATYGKITATDVETWKQETLQFAAEGSRVFHSGDLLMSQIAVSCDMCHPDASNTHPETYPKFQPQLGRVALLRDMINWCIEHPVRGQRLAADDPHMRALEAYIIAQRKGKTLNYGQR